MPIHYACDRCGRRFESNASDRYVVRVEVFAAAEPLEISPQDLARDHRAEIQRLAHALDRMNPDDVEDQIYRSFRFDLCRDCHRLYLSDPLGSVR